MRRSIPSATSFVRAAPAATRPPAMVPGRAEPFGPGNRAGRSGLGFPTRPVGRPRLAFALLVLLGLGFWSGGPGRATASSGGGPEPVEPAAAQSGFELIVAAANCQIEPPLPPTLDEAGCAAAAGAVVTAVDDDGAEIGGCATDDVWPNGEAARCTILVPYDSSGQVYEDPGTIPAGFTPRRNPIPFSAPPEGPLTGLPSYPIFVNLPDGGGDQGGAEPAQATQRPEPVDPIVPAPAEDQEQDPDHIATLVAGTCADPGDPVAAPIALVAPAGDPIGLPTALIAETGGGALPLPLDDLFAAPHAIVVIAAGGTPAPTLACGDLGSVADEDGVAVIGLAPAGDSGLAGIAYLTTDPANPAQTLASVFVAEGLT